MSMDGQVLGVLPSSLSTSCILLLATAIFMLGSLQPTTALDFSYHKHAQMGRFLKNLNSKYPKITMVSSIGKSNLGNDLYVIMIGKYAKRPKRLVPNVKYIANMHGNEAVGREMLLHLANHFVTEYSKNKTIKNFLDKTTVHLMPTMNPDGFSFSNVNDCMSVKGRGNTNYFDLNRNFPDPYKAPETMQKETKLVERWTSNINFVLSANLHGGAEVVNYPWDSLKGDMLRVQYSASPDDDVFRHLALTYSRSHATMYQGASCGDYFKDGITNGAKWYPVLGSMADYMYRNGRGYELLIEMSCCKYPDPSTLPDFWTKNKEALINLLYAVHIGVKGFVYTENYSNVKTDITNASVVIQGREEIATFTSKSGEYYKLLLPGEYVLKVSKEGYQPQIIPFKVYSYNNVTILNVKLYPIKVVSDLNFDTVSTLVSTATFTNTTTASTTTASTITASTTTASTATASTTTASTTTASTTTASTTTASTTTASTTTASTTTASTTTAFTTTATILDAVRDDAVSNSDDMVTKGSENTHTAGADEEHYASDVENMFKKTSSVNPTTERSTPQRKDRFKWTTHNKVQLMSRTSTTQKVTGKTSFITSASTINEHLGIHPTINAVAGPYLKRETTTRRAYGKVPMLNRETTTRRANGKEQMLNREMTTRRANGKEQILNRETTTKRANGKEPMLNREKTTKRANGKVQTLYRETTTKRDSYLSHQKNEGNEIIAVNNSHTLKNESIESQNPTGNSSLAKRYSMDNENNAGKLSQSITTLFYTFLLIAMSFLVSC